MKCQETMKYQDGRVAQARKRKEGAQWRPRWQGRRGEGARNEPTNEKKEIRPITLMCGFDLLSTDAAYLECLSDWADCIQTIDRRLPSFSDAFTAAACLAVAVDTQHITCHLHWTAAMVSSSHHVRLSSCCNAPPSVVMKQQPAAIIAQPSLQLINATISDPAGQSPRIFRRASCRITKHRKESLSILQNPEESQRIQKNLRASWRILKILKTY